MIDLSQYSPSLIYENISKEVKAMINNSSSEECLQYFTYGQTLDRYSVWHKLINKTWSKLCYKNTPPITLKTIQTHVSQTEIDLVKGNPTDPNFWPHIIKDNIRDLEDVPNDTPKLVMVYVPKGFSFINIIGQSNETRPHFQRFPNAETLYQMNDKHRHAMLKIGPNQYMYLTNQWDNTLIFKILIGLPLLFPNQFNEKALEIVTHILKDRIPVENLIKIMSDIIIDPNEKLNELRKSLRGIESNMRQQELEKYTAEAAVLKERIRQTEIEISDTWHRLSEVNKQLSYGSAVTNEADMNDDLFNYIIRQPDIKDIQYKPPTMQLTICNELEHFDKSAFISTLLNRSSKWWESSNNIGAVLVAAFCFLSERYRIVTKTIINLNLTEKKVDKEKNSNEVSKLSEYSGIMHPHIMRLGCFGSNKPQITAAMGNGNYLAAVAQSVAACKNMNMTDRSAIGYLLEEIKVALQYGRAFIKDNETGQLITMNQLRANHVYLFQDKFMGNEGIKMFLQSSKGELDAIATLINEEATNE
jgi:hypothetical protein